MAIEPGTRLGPYEITARIGAGGMGEVFRARDTRLDRTVAIKISAEQFSDRFEREARAVAALNHPHICTLYDVGPNYLVMEFVDGKPLAGPLPPAEALRYAIQIAQALEAAAHSGIVHRDLKPGNILVTKAGIKLLDFGLAKMARTSGAGSDQTVTMAMTADHTIMGTLQYMAPEQLEGKEADARSDIFAFGLVLYEMVTGRLAFQAASQASLIAAVLKEQPAPLPEVTPPALERIIRTCLEKDPDDRWQTARDLRRELEWSAAPQAAATAERPKRSVLPWTVAAVLAAAIATGIALLPRHPAPASFDPVPLTWYPGLESDPALSPDGKLVAFTWTGPGFDQRQVYVKQLDASQPLRITREDKSYYSSPAWSPDGRQLAVTKVNQKGPALVLIPALGGPEREVGRFNGWGSSCWLPVRNSIVVTDCGSRRCGLATIAVDGGKHESLTNPDRGTGATGIQGDSYPALSPDGRTLAFVRGGEVTTSLDDVYLLPLDSRQSPNGAERKLIGGLQAIHGLAWAPDGRSLFVSSVRNSARRISRVRASDGVLEPIGVGVSGASQPFVSAASRRMTFVWEQHDTDIFRVPGPGWKAADGPPPAAQPVVASIYDDTTAYYSADGKRIAFDSEATGHQEIWVADADGRNAVPITSFNGPPVGTPRWSPDGSKIAFDSRKYGNGDIYLIDASGGTPVQLTNDPASESRPIWSSDGKFIFFYSDKTGRSEIWKIPSGGGAAVQVTKTGGTYPRTLAGEPWIYYNVGNEVWRMPESGGTPEKIADNAPSPVWAPYHGGLVAYNYKDLAIRPKGGDWQRLRNLPGASPNFFRAPTLSITPDDKWVVLHLTTLDRADLLLVENIR